MNADTYRLVFNAQRGGFMAVAESARSCGKGRQAGTGARRRRAHLSRDAASFVGARGALELAAASLGNTDTLGTDQGIEGRSLAVTANAIDNRRGAMRADTEGQ